MARYTIPDYATNALDGEILWVAMKSLNTAGRKPLERMDSCARITRKRLTKANWDQLNAVSKGSFVNHLGRGHQRDQPRISEAEWDRKYFKMDTCLGCVYTVHYHHTCDPNRAEREERISNASRPNG